MLYRNIFKTPPNISTSQHKTVNTHQQKRLNLMHTQENLQKFINLYKSHKYQDFNSPEIPALP